MRVIAFLLLELLSAASGGPIKHASQFGPPDSQQSIPPIVTGGELQQPALAAAEVSDRDEAFSIPTCPLGSRCIPSSLCSSAEAITYEQPKDIYHPTSQFDQQAFTPKFTCGQSAPGYVCCREGGVLQHNISRISNPFGFPDSLGSGDFHHESSAVSGSGLSTGPVVNTVSEAGSKGFSTSSGDSGGPVFGFDLVSGQGFDGSQGRPDGFSHTGGHPQGHDTSFSTSGMFPPSPGMFPPGPGMLPLGPGMPPGPGMFPPKPGMFPPSSDGFSSSPNSFGSSSDGFTSSTSAISSSSDSFFSSRPVPRRLQQVLIRGQQHTLPEFSSVLVLDGGAEALVTHGARLVSMELRPTPGFVRTGRSQTVMLQGQPHVTGEFVYVSDPSNGPIIVTTDGVPGQYSITGGEQAGEFEPFIPWPELVMLAADIFSQTSGTTVGVSGVKVDAVPPPSVPPQTPSTSLEPPPIFKKPADFHFFGGDSGDLLGPFIDPSGDVFFFDEDTYLTFEGDSSFGSPFGDSSFGSPFGDSSFGSSFGDSSFGSPFGDSSFGASFVDSSFVDSSFVDSSFVDSSFVDSSFVDSSFGDSSFGDSSFVDSSFVDSSFGSSFGDSSFGDSSFGGEFLAGGTDHGPGHDNGHSSSGHGPPPPHDHHSPPHHHPHPPPHRPPPLHHPPRYPVHHPPHRRPRPPRYGLRHGFALHRPLLPQLHFQRPHLPQLPAPFPVATETCGLRGQLSEFYTSVYGEYSGRISSGFGLEPGVADYASYPWHAAILRRTPPHDPRGQRLGGLEYLCGASLVSENMLVTAAHCVQGEREAELVIRLGEYNLYSEKEELYKPYDATVLAIHVHPDYLSSVYRADLAVLQLTAPVPLASLPHVTTACLPGPDLTVDHVTCEVPGWGYDAYKTLPEGSPHALKAVAVHPTPPDVCEASLRATLLGPAFSLQAGSFCAVGSHGQDTCLGDGGGGLVCPRPSEPGETPKYQLVGVTSWGVRCGQGTPGVYTNVAAYKTWLQTII